MMYLLTRTQDSGHLAIVISETTWARAVSAADKYAKELKEDIDIWKLQGQVVPTLSTQFVVAAEEQDKVDD